MFQRNNSFIPIFSFLIVLIGSSFTLKGQCNEALKVKGNFILFSFTYSNLDLSDVYSYLIFVDTLDNRFVQLKDSNYYSIKNNILLIDIFNNSKYQILHNNELNLLARRNCKDFYYDTNCFTFYETILNENLKVGKPDPSFTALYKGRKYLTKLKFYTGEIDVYKFQGTQSHPAIKLTINEENFVINVSDKQIFLPMNCKLNEVQK